MPHDYLPLQLLLAVLLFTLVAAAGDTLASRQMALERFRFVPLVKAMRAARAPAVALALTFGLVCLFSEPTLAVPAVLLAAVVGLLSQARMLACGAYTQAAFRGFLPSLLSLLALAHHGLRPLAGNQPFQTGPLMVALLAAFGFWYIAHQRTQQDLLRLRD